MPFVDGGKLTSTAVHVVTASMLVGSALSFCGSLFACACYIVFKSKRTFGLQLVFLLSANDVMTQLWVFTQGARALASGSTSEHALCLLQAYLASYFNLACTLWSACIAYTLFATVMLEHSVKQVSRLFPHFLIFAQGVPVVSCAVSTAFGAYGQAGAWCWIPSDTLTSEVLQLATMYVPCWLCILFNAAVYVRVRLRLRQSLRAQKEWLPAVAPTDRIATGASYLRPAPDAGGGNAGLAEPLLEGGASQLPLSRSHSLWDRFRVSTARLTSAPDFEAGDDDLSDSGESEAGAVESVDWKSTGSRPASLELVRATDGTLSPAAPDPGGEGTFDSDLLEKSDSVAALTTAGAPTWEQDAIAHKITQRHVRAKRLAGRLLVYPLILAFCWTWATIDRVHGLFSSRPIFWMALSHGVAISIIGFLNSIAYGLTDGIRQEVVKAARRLCGLQR